MAHSHGDSRAGPAWQPVNSTARGRTRGAGAVAGPLGQVIVNRLFSAGLDLSSALSQIPDGPAAARIRHAVSELDEALISLRHLVFAVDDPITRPTSPDDDPPGRP